MSFNLSNFLTLVRQKYEHEPEFIQALTEIFSSLEAFLIEHPHYSEHGLIERIIEPERIISFRIVWEDDNHNVQVNRGWRIQFNSALGPYKGGLRFHPSVNQSILKFLGFEQTFKNSLTGLSLGGGKGGSDFDPHGKSNTEVMRFCQSFMTELSRHIGPSTDVPAGDIGVGAREIGYLFGQYKKLQNTFDGTLTGKGIQWGGSRGRTEATGYGVIYFLKNMLAEKGKSLAGKKILISGSGNVAQYAAEKAIHEAAQVVTMSDSNGYIYDPEGITLEKLEYIKKLKNIERGRISEYVKQYPEAHYIENQKPWEIPADIALPCATQNEITHTDAEMLVAQGISYIVEGSNMSSTNEAIEIFHTKKIPFSPGKASNAGGVSVSGLEMAQNSMRLSWSQERVDEELQTIMKNIHDTAKQHGTDPDGYINYVRGANIAGFKRVADAMIDQGLV